MTHKVGAQLKESPELKAALAESKSEKEATTTGFSALRFGIEDKEKNDKSAAKEEALNAAGDIVAAAKDLNRADKLLKIPTK